MNRYKYILIVVLLFSFLIFTPNSVQAANFFVSTSGNDNNNGTESSPWKTIQKAADSLNNGDSLTVLAGDYPELVNVTRSGISFTANGITKVKGFRITADNVSVKGFSVSNSDLSDSDGIYAQGSNIIIEQNIINDVPNNGILLFTGSSNSVVRNNKITKARNSCIWTTGQNNLIESNDCSYTIQPTTDGGDADCFRYFGGGHTFRGNYCHDIPTDGVLVRTAHTDCFQTWNWTSVGGVGHDILFEKNACILPFDGPEFSAKIWQSEEGSYNLTMKNNIGVASLIALIYDGTNISFLNNTFIGSDTTADGLHLSRTSINMYNNIFAHQKQRVIEKIDTAVNITASNNCYVDYGVMLAPNSGDIMATDAKFANESLNNYHLLQNSPCINKGAILPEVIDDKDGISRPQGSIYDMGAYEYLEVANETPTPTPIPTSIPTPTPTSAPVTKTGDLNNDGIVNIIDIGIVIDNYGQISPSNTKTDINNDGLVNIVDIGIIIDNYGQ